MRPSPGPSPGRQVQRPVSSDRFDRWANSYDSSQLQDLLYQPAHRAVIGCAHLPLKQRVRVLDVGCGTGRLAQEIVGRYDQAQVVGIDPSAQMIKCAAAITTRPGNLVLAIARAEQLPFRDATFELVVITMSFRHWQDREAAFAEIRRVMALKATLVLADIFPASRGRWQRVLRRKAGNPLPCGVRRLLDSQGLRFERVAPVRSVSCVEVVVVVVAVKRG
jgi:ubiquinone/menaquinone biosynthesis C-methylase UbiE